MKKYNLEFYSDNGYLLGEALKDYKDFSEVEKHLEELMSGSSVRISSKDMDGNSTTEFLRVQHIVKIIATEQK